MFYGRAGTQNQRRLRQSPRILGGRKTRGMLLRLMQKCVKCIVNVVVNLVNRGFELRARKPTDLAYKTGSTWVLKETLRMISSCARASKEDSTQNLLRPLRDQEVRFHPYMHVLLTSSKNVYLLRICIFKAYVIYTHPNLYRYIRKLHSFRLTKYS